MKNFWVSLLCFMAGHAATYGETLQWREYHFPYFGLRYEMPHCGFKDEDPCVGLDLYVAVDIDDFTLVAGVVHESDEEYDLENPFDETQSKPDFLPQISIDDFPAIASKAAQSLAFYTEDAYELRHFFSLGNGWHFMVAFEGYDPYMEHDSTAMHHFWSKLQFETPQKNIQAEAGKVTPGLNNSGPLKGSYSSKLVAFGTSAHGFGTKLRVAADNSLHLMWLHKDDGVRITKLDANFQPISTCEFDDFRGYYDFQITSNGYALLVSENQYHNREEVKPRSYYSGLYVLLTDRNGNELKRIPLEKEGIIEKRGDRRFHINSNGQISLSLSPKHLVAYYSVNQKFEDGLTHQGDALRVFTLEGVELQDKSRMWYVSHSFAQVGGYHQGYFSLFGLGDGYPRGITYTHLKVDDPTDVPEKQNVFPFAGEKGWNYVGDTRFSQVVQHKGLTYLAITTEENITSTLAENVVRENDLLLLCFNNKGQKVFEKNITNTPSVDEGEPYVAIVQNQVMVMWRQSGYYVDLQDGYPERYKLVSLDGKTVSPESSFQTFATYKMHHWCEMGHDFLTYDLPEMSDFVQDAQGNSYAVRFLPFYHSGYIEVVKLSAN